jgi:predicted lipoprotein with Yx(FWY)xxD motif
MISAMKTISLLFSIALLAVAGCGGDDGGSDSGSGAADTGTTVEDQRNGAATKVGDAEAETGGTTRTGTSVVLGDSEFGRILFDSKRQAIYIFERDETDKSNCYGDCAEAWPPVFTKGEPRPGKGVDRSLLGTTKRRDGRLQVTYAGKPLYYYANEGPGEVKCHNVNLNGGFWWVLGADGERLQ